MGTAATMGLAVGVWTTVARRPARVEAELVGGSAIDGIFCDGLRSSHAKRLRSAREIEAQCRQETIRTQTNHRTISIDNALSDGSWGGSHEPVSVHSAARLHPAFHRARRIAAFGLWRQQHSDL